jgi:hypothetical protein
VRKEGEIAMGNRIENRDSVNTTSPSEEVCAPAMPERDGNVLEPMLTIAFVLVGPTSDIYRLSKAFGEVLPEYPEVKVVYKKSSLGRLWIVDGKPDG